MGDGAGASALAAARLGYRPAGRGAWALIDFFWVAWLAWIYDWINNLAAVRQALAERNGASVLRVERSLRIDPEHALNAWLATHHALTKVVVFYYENAHAGVTFALFGWLWWRRPDILPPLRAALIAANVVALAVFWSFPVAPPRMLAQPQFQDLVAVVHGLGAFWPVGASAVDSNQLAALPSLHLAWAVWSSVVVFELTRSRLVRGAALLYPLLTAFAVMATANHYALDALSGAALGGVASLGALWLFRRPRRRVHGAH